MRGALTSGAARVVAAGSAAGSAAGRAPPPAPLPPPLRLLAEAEPDGSAGRPGK